MFVDRDTLRFVMLDQLLSKVNPLTEYGKKSLDGMKCLIKNGEDFQKHWERLVKVFNMDSRKVQIIKQHLLRMGSIDQQMNYGFKTVGDFARLKRFVYHCRELADLGRDIWFFPDLSDLWVKLSDLTGDQEGFNLRSEKMLSLRKDHLLISKELENAKSRLIQEIESEFSIKLPDDEFTCDENVAKDIIEKDFAEVVRRSAGRYHLKLKPTGEMLKLADKLNKIEEFMTSEEQHLLSELEKIAGEFFEVLKVCEMTVEQIDLDLCRYDFFFLYKCCQPEISEKIIVKSGRYPPVKEFCEKNDYQYYPVDIEINRGITVLYGPNMGGKTTVLRTIGCFVILFHMGFPIPADTFSCPVLGFVRYVSRGDGVGLSSFASEIVSFNSILSLPGKKFVLIDEFGSTTNPVEGEALAVAAVKCLNDSDDYFLFTSHYPEVVKIASRVYMCGKIKNFDADDPHRMIDYSIEKDIKSNQKMALLLAKKLGLSEKIVEAAENFLRKGEDSG